MLGNKWLVVESELDMPVFGVLSQLGLIILRNIL